MGAPPRSVSGVVAVYSVISWLPLLWVMTLPPKPGFMTYHVLGGARERVDPERQLFFGHPHFFVLCRPMSEYKIPAKRVNISFQDRCVAKRGSEFEWETLCWG